MAYTPVPQDTPWQQGHEIDVLRTAVLVIDVLGGNSGLPAGFEDEASNCVRIVKAARDKHMPVIFSDDQHVPVYDRELELWGEHGVAETEDAKPLDEFDVQESDIIVPKRRYDGFFQTDLDLTLHELGVDTLIVVGTDTNICVLQTLAGAYFRGYKTVVVADATWTFLVGTLENGLEYFAKCYDSRIVDTETALAYLA